MDKEFQNFVRLYTTGQENKINIPKDVLSALKNSDAANKVWETLSRKNQLNWILWIISGKLKETRVVRMSRMINMLEKGKKRVCCFGGVNWLVKTRK